MKYLFILLVALLYTAVASARPAQEKPNIFIIFLDDCGYGDFSHTGNPTIHTPEISRLVREGANFPQFYSASPACSASRYALLTGRNPRRSGLGTWVLGPGNARHLHPDEVTLAEGLRQGGYATAMYGKWHLGNPNPANANTPDSLPLAHGFQQWLGTNVSNDYNPGANLMRGPAEADQPIAGYEILAQDFAEDRLIQESLTARYADASIEFLRQHKSQPFFIYLAPNMPHLPVHASDDFKGKSLRGRYGDCIEEIDHHVGRIRAALVEEGLAENTLLIFSSDNGPWIRFQDTPEHALYDEAQLLIGSALPFRDGKGSTWEGGVRVPGVWWWPGTIAPATVVRQPASTLDIFPTVFALAGEPMPDDRALDGRDIRPLLNPSLFRGNVAEFEFIYTGQPDNQVFGARKGPWKLHAKLFSQTSNNYGFAPNSPSVTRLMEPLLFQVEHDPFERIDRRESEPGCVAELQALIDAFQASLAAEGTFWGAP
jgi:arylsulfatase A